MKIQSMQPSDNKQDPFKKFLEETLPLPEEDVVIIPALMPQSESTEVAVVDLASNTTEVTNENLVEEANKIDLIEETFNIVNLENEEIILTDLDVFSVLAFAAHLMITGFNIKIIAKNSNVECFAYLAKTDEYVSTFEMFANKIIETYHLILKSAFLLDSHRSVFTHYKAKELMVQENIDYDTAIQKLTVEDNQNFISQQKAISQAMPGLIIKRKGD